MIGRPKLVLASGSPRRVTLINQAGIEPDALRPAELDETPKRGELPRACANRLAAAVEYWPTADPTAAEGNREQRLDAYRAVRDQLMARIQARFAA